MAEAARYSAIERLRDGREIEVRALKAADEGAMIAAVARIGAQSLYRRFFGVKRAFSEEEKTFFLNVDFVKHVALVAVVHDSGGNFIVGGGRYVVVRPGTAEVAFAVIDDFQGLGIGSTLMRHIVLLARNAGIGTLIAEVLPENSPMIKVFQKSGLDTQINRRNGVIHVVMNLH